MPNFFGPIPIPWRQLENSAATVNTIPATAAVLRGAVKITGGVHNQARVGFVFVHPVVSKVVHNPLTPIPIGLETQLEYRAAAIVAASRRLPPTESVP